MFLSKNKMIHTYDRRILLLYTLTLYNNCMIVYMTFVALM